MVVSTMAALIVLVTAMYMAVMSSRTAQYTVFNQEQAYVSATSISDIITAYIVDGTNSSKPLVTKIKALDVGNTITTDGNGFAALTADGTGAADGILGGYDVTITRLADEKDGGTKLRVYDIAVTVSRNGTLETTHAQISIPESKPAKMPAIEQFFTATGYLPNDVLLDSLSETDSPLVFDAEYVDLGTTIFGKTGAGGAGTEPVIASDIICAGSLSHDYGQFTASKPITWVVGNNLILDRNMSYSLGSTSGRGQMCVGDTLYFMDANGGIGSTGKETDIFVQGGGQLNGVSVVGDAYFGGSINCDAVCHFNEDLHVGGNVDAPNGLNVSGITVIHGNATIVGGTLGGDVYIDGNAVLKGVSISGTTYIKGSAEIYAGCKFTGDVVIGGDAKMFHETGTAPGFSGKLIVIGDLSSQGGQLGGGAYVGGDMNWFGSDGATQWNSGASGNIYVKGNANIDVMQAGSVGLYVNGIFTLYGAEWDYGFAFGSYHVNGNGGAYKVQEAWGKTPSIPTYTAASWVPTSTDEMMALLDVRDDISSEYTAAPAEGSGRKYSYATECSSILSDKATLMNEKIGGSIYPKWKVSSSAFSDVEEIAFNANPSADDADTTPKYVHYIDRDCTIGAIYNNTGDGLGYRFTIIINTGSREDDVRKLRVSPNCGDGKTFSWLPNADKGGNVVNIITIGNGTLEIDVPEGVTYQSTDHEFFGHISWFMMAGGSIDTDAAGQYLFKNPSSTSWMPMLQNHGILHNGCSACTYEEAEIGGQDVITCTTHGGTFSEADYEAYKNGERTCLCHGRVDKAKVDAFYASNGAALTELTELGDIEVGGTKLISDSDSLSIDNLKYPNVNIFVISCEESADIQFGCSKNEPASSALEQNKFFGYVYAPYMTFISFGSGGGDMKCAGGLIVSDYVISAAYSYIYVQPTRTIENIAGTSELLTPSGNRDWRIYGV